MKYKKHYKRFLRLKQNIQDRPKLFKLKRKKWQNFQKNLKKQHHKRFKIKDQFQLSVSNFASRGNSFKRKFQNNLCQREIFSLFYGNLKKKYLKKSILKLINTKSYIDDYRHIVFNFFESRLDTVLCRANFSSNIQQASQLILHGHVFVNGIIIKTKSYKLKPNDLIEIGYNLKSRDLIKKNINESSNFRILPPKHLLVNYKTFQILFVYLEDSNLMPIFHHYLNLDSVIANIKSFFFSSSVGRANGC